MSYRVQLRLSNPTVKPVTTVIYRGTVFEVEDPFSKTQNLVAIQDTTIAIAPGNNAMVLIDTWCMNKSFSPPHNTPVQLTALTLKDLPDSQAKLWDFLDKRK